MTGTTSSSRSEDVPPPDVRLIVADLDGTLLDGHGKLPAATWPVLAELERRGILFCPASGRQYENIAGIFGPAGRRMVVVAENGTYVVQDGQELSSDTLGADSARAVLTAVRTVVADGADIGAVLCGKRSAYIERHDPAFVRQAATYYSRLATVDDLAAVRDDPLKIAIYDFGTAELSTAPVLRHLTGELQVVVSGPHWTDVMTPTASKGAAVEQIQRTYGILPAQTVVFGDYLNDLTMMAVADHSFAVANAHPDLLKAARFVAPANTENGVLRAIAGVLGLPEDRP